MECIMYCFNRPNQPLEVTPLADPDSLRSYGARARTAAQL
jgi:hypothetical protein